ncbi:MFS transporter [Streptomyces rubiginosohelvolus]|uniref:MFS transporter n=1 Tax=Streptomyces rubiginosohelvolus TaxID=67362 RepID=UPI0037F51956
MTEERLLRASGDTLPGIFSRPYAAATLTFATVMLLTGFAALAVVPTLPTAAEDLDGVALFPLVAGCFVAASLLGGVLGGHWADRSGARRPLALGMILSVVTLLVSASSVSVWQLVIGRFVDGLAAGMVAVSVTTAIGQSYPEYLRPRMLAMMSASWIIPSLIGPPIAGVVAEAWSWRVVFYSLAALTALPAIALVAVLRRAPANDGTDRVALPDDLPPAEERASRPPLLVAAMLSLGAALGQYGVSGWDTRHLLFVAAGVALLVVFAPRLLPAGTWRSARGLPTAVLLRGLTSGTYFTVEALVPLMLITERRVAAVTVGVLDGWWPAPAAHSLQGQRRARSLRSRALRRRAAFRGSSEARSALPVLDPAQVAGSSESSTAVLRPGPHQVERTGLAMEPFVSSVLELRITTGSAHYAWRQQPL